MKIFLVTGNPKKAQLIGGMFEELPVKIEAVDLELEEHQTLDMAKVSKHKAAQAFQKLKKPVLVDDSGIYFERYNQFPGVLSRHVFEGLGQEGMRRIIEDGDRANFQSVISYMDKELKEPISFFGKVGGSIKCSGVKEMIPPMPYGYIFVPDGYDEVSIKLSDWEMQNVSHRGTAVKEFKKWLKQNRLKTPA